MNAFDDDPPRSGSTDRAEGVAVSLSELIEQIGRLAETLAAAAVPESAADCQEQARQLLAVRDRLTSAITARVHHVHSSRQARASGHASTRAWLRGACGTTSATAATLLTLATQLPRLPDTRTRYAQGTLSEDQVMAICRVVAPMDDSHARTAEPILLGLADVATPAEVAKAGRYLQAVADPEEADHQADIDYRRRFLLVQPTTTGGMEGHFRLPREAAARLQALLGAHAGPRSASDERPLRVRNADALIALLEQQVTTELLVVVNAESLPDDPPPAHSNTARPADAATATVRNAGAHLDRVPVNLDQREVPSDDQIRGEPDDHPRGQVPDTDLWDCLGPDLVADCDSVDPQGADPCPSTGTLRRREHLGQRDGQQPDGRDNGRSGQDTGRGEADWRQLASRTLPGLLLATGYLLPVSDIHRLARTSTLIRLVLNADHRVLDMGRKVRLATPAQRRAILARYATCWVDGCPLPATWCQIDHADNWAGGGATDLDKLGPACHFHNRDRYRRPHRYQRRQVGTDRWAFTYLDHPPGTHHKPTTEPSVHRMAA